MAKRSRKPKPKSGTKSNRIQDLTDAQLRHIAVDAKQYAGYQSMAGQDMTLPGHRNVVLTAFLADEVVRLRQELIRWGRGKK